MTNAWGLLQQAQSTYSHKQISLDNKYH